MKKANNTITVAPRLLHTLSRVERRFLNFNHLTKEFLEQMMIYVVKNAPFTGTFSGLPDSTAHHFEAS